jgi:hypothetical protein
MNTLSVGREKGFPVTKRVSKARPSAAKGVSYRQKSQFSGCDALDDREGNPVHIQEHVIPNSGSIVTIDRICMNGTLTDASSTLFYGF